MDDIRHCSLQECGTNTDEQQLVRIEPTIMPRRHTEKCMPNWEVTIQLTGSSVKDWDSTKRV